MWFLSSFCGDNADYTIYKIRYMGYQDSSNVLESGFSLYVRLCHLLHFDFRMFLIVTYAAIYIMLSWFVLKNVKKPNMFLFPYSISVFFIDYLQIRNYIAFSLILIGLHYFIKDNTSKANMVFIVMVVVASMFHFACIFYLLFLLVKKVNINDLVLWIVIFDIIGVLFLRPKTVFFICKLFIGERKANQILNFNTQLVEGSENGMKFVLKYYIVIIVTCCVMWLVSYVFRQKKIHTAFLSFRSVQNPVSEKIVCLKKCVLMCLLILPALLYNVEIYRLQRNSVLIFYALIAMYCNAYGKNKLIYRDDDGGLCVNININYAVLLTGSIIILYVQVYKLATFEKTATALFENNVLF